MKLFLFVFLLVPSLAHAAVFPEFSDFASKVTTSLVVSERVVEIENLSWRVKDQCSGQVHSDTNLREFS